MSRIKTAVCSASARFVLSVPAIPQDLRAAFLTLGLSVEGRTMLSRRRLTALYLNCTDPSLPVGSFVECGVARGGSVAMMALAAAGMRDIWGFDSFDAMPSLTEEDKSDGQQWVGFRCSGSDGLAEAQRTLRRFRVAGPNINLVRGWFEDTLMDHLAKISPIAVLRLDNDWYKSTKYCLETLYASVSPNGLVIIDDYHTFSGCRDAVDEFRAKLGIEDPLVTTEADSEVYWRKENQ
jgi:O-methyltransferase